MIKRLTAILTLAFTLLAPTAFAGTIQCGISTTGTTVNGVPFLDTTADCVAATPFNYGQVTPQATVANSNLCPLNQVACSQRQWRCDAETALMGNAAPIYSDQPTCTTACNWTATCSSAPFTKTLSGAGTGTICVDSNMTIALQDAGGGTKFRLAMLDTDPGGTAHWNCEPPIVNLGGDFPSYTPPIYAGWHIINHPGDARDPIAGIDIDFGPFLPANSGTDGWNSAVEYCVTPITHLCGGSYAACSLDSNGDGFLDARTLAGGERCAHAPGVAVTWPGAWDPDPGSSVMGFYYRYSITLANNIYACGVDPSAVCQGADGSTSFSPQYYRTLTTDASMLGVFSNSVCTGTCPSTGVVDVGSQPANTMWLGDYSIAGTKDSYHYYFNTSPTYAPSTTKTCTKQGTCFPEPVCPTGFNCDCSAATQPTCPNSVGSFVGADGLCEVNVSTLCPAGSTYDGATGVDSCISGPTCASGGVFDSTLHLCTTPISLVCDNSVGYYFNSSTMKCEDLLVCPAGSTWDPVNKWCLSNSSICTAGFGYDFGVSECYTSATCTNGTLNSSTDKCEYAPSCLAGTSYSPTYNKCTVASTGPSGTTLDTALDLYTSSPTCPSGGTYTSGTGQCRYNANSCPSGGTLSGTTCQITPTCNAGFTYSAANNRCEIAATPNTTYSCPSGGTLSGTTCSYTATAYGTRSCVSGWTLKGSGTNTKCLQAASPSSQCIGNYTLQGKTDTFWVQAGVSFTYTAWACRNPTGSWFWGGWWDGTYYWILPLPAGPTVGSYSAWEGSTLVSTCTAASNSCLGSGTISTGETVTLVGAVGPLRSIAYYTPNPVITYSCPSGGTLSGTTCSYAATGTTTYSCSTGTLSGTICYQSATCSAGILNTSTDKCEYAAGCGAGFTQSGSICYKTATCPSGATLDGVNNRCWASPSCLAGTAYSAADNVCEVASTCANGGVLNTSLDICQQPPNCAAGTAYVSTRDRCEQAPAGTPFVCSSGMVYDSSTGKCRDTLTCPTTGINFSSMTGTFTGLTPLCQTNPDTVCPSPYSPNGLVNCTAVADCPAGAALDIGTNKCRLPGAGLCPASWGFDAASDTCRHTPVCGGKTYNSATQTCCDCSSPNGCETTVANPTVNDYMCSPATCQDLTAGVVTTTVNTSYVQNNLGFSGKSCAGQMYVFTGKPKTCRTQGWDTFGQNCCDLPTGSMGSVCSTDWPANEPSVGRLCHYVGKTCVDSWPAVGCVQQAQTYCCFDNVLERIVQEQGRPMLQRYNAAYCASATSAAAIAACVANNVYWGTPTVPDCNGLRPEELQMIDWSKIDFSEYLADVTAAVNATIGGVNQSAVQSNTSNFLSQTVK